MTFFGVLLSSFALLDTLPKPVKTGTEDVGWEEPSGVLLVPKENLGAFEGLINEGQIQSWLTLVSLSVGIAKDENSRSVKPPISI